MALVHAEEIGWFEHAEGQVVGSVIRDKTDDDFGGLVFAQDAKLRFRSVNVTHFEPSIRRAEVTLRRAMEAAAMASPEDHHQGDEHGLPVDFFAFAREVEKLNPDFVQLANLEAYSPARESIEAMMRWYEDADGNFIEQFQTTGFDQRIWELYLFATFIEMGFEIDRSDPVPDFLCSGLGGEIAVEAVTVGPTRIDGKIVPPPKLNSPEDVQAYLRHYMPIKFGSALYTKLGKAYWERPNVKTLPLIFAIEDFSSPGSMTHTRSALECYVYGYEHKWNHNDRGQLTVTPHKIESHEWGAKKIPSGFFDLPNSENVSAVLFSNSGTIAKFNRMGVIGEFGSKRVLLIREGTYVDHDPNATEPKAFRQIVNAPDYKEVWSEGLDVFHNPRALIPLEPSLLPGAAHHFLQDDGNVVSYTSDWHPLGSVTRHYAPVDVEAELERLAASNK